MVIRKEFLVLFITGRWAVQGLAAVVSGTAGTVVVVVVVVRRRGVLRLRGEAEPAAHRPLPTEGTTQ